MLTKKEQSVAFSGKGPFILNLPLCIVENDIWDIFCDSITFCKNEYIFLASMPSKGGAILKIFFQETKPRGPIAGASPAWQATVRLRLL